MNPVVLVLAAIAVAVVPVAVAVAVVLLVRRVRSGGQGTEDTVSSADRLAGVQVSPFGSDGPMAGPPPNGRPLGNAALPPEYNQAADLQPGSTSQPIEAQASPVEASLGQPTEPLDDEAPLWASPQADGSIRAPHPLVEAEAVPSSDSAPSVVDEALTAPRRSRLFTGHPTERPPDVPGAAEVPPSGVPLVAAAVPPTEPAPNAMQAPPAPPPPEPAPSAGLTSPAPAVDGAAPRPVWAPPSADGRPSKVVHISALPVELRSGVETEWLLLTPIDAIGNWPAGGASVPAPAHAPAPVQPPTPPPAPPPAPAPAQAPPPAPPPVDEPVWPARAGTSGSEPAESVSPVVLPDSLLADLLSNGPDGEAG